MTVWHWKELVPRFGSSQGYAGIVELVNCINGQSTVGRYHNQLTLAGVEAQAARLAARDGTILADLMFDPFREKVAESDLLSYTTYMAQDYIFQTAIPVAAHGRFKHVLDFGSGSGRQFGPWSMHADLKTFISIDALPQTYCTQHWYFSFFDMDHRDYVLADNDFPVTPSDIEPILYHLPTERMQDIPSDMLDLVRAVQVLGELRPDLFHWVVAQFMRVLRLGGCLYIRDHGMRHCANKIDIPTALNEAGFVLEYEPYLRDLVDIHGIPRLWRKPDLAVT